jgi:general secretion pathway protein D
MRGLKWTLAVGTAAIGLATATTAFAQQAEGTHLTREEAARLEALLLRLKSKPAPEIKRAGAAVPEVVKRGLPFELPAEPADRIPTTFTAATEQERPAPAGKQPTSAEPQRPAIDPAQPPRPAADPPQPPLTKSPSGRIVTPPMQTGDGRIGEIPRDFSRIAIERVGPDQFIITGATPEMLESFGKLLEELDKAGGLAEADVDFIPLQHAESSQMARLLTAIYTARGEVRAAAGGQAAAPAGQQGKVSFVPVGQPNGVVIVARKADLPDIGAHVREIDNRSREGEQFKVVPLKKAPALQVANKLKEFFILDRTAQQTPGATGATSAFLRLRVEVIPDERTNSLLIYGGPADMAQAEILIQRFDTDQIEATVEVRYFVLKNTSATEMQTLLQNSVLRRSQAAAGTGAAAPAQPGTGQQQPPFGQQQGQQAAATSTGSTGGVKSAKVRMLVADRSGAFIESGVLEDITIATDPRANGLLVIAPKETMGLIEELIKQLDLVPNPAAELKIFTLKNADAQAMLQTLQAFFGSSTGGTLGGNQGQFGQQFNQGQGQTQGGTAQPRSFQLGGLEPQLSLTPLSFSVDQRTNSLLVAGSANDLIAVEALVRTLDDNNARERKNFVYRLNNIPAEEADITIQAFLQAQAQGAITGALGAAASGVLTTQQQITQDVVIVADITTNSLIISSSQRYFEEILKMIQILDRRPPQVVIQVLIAEVTLQQNDEFGVELGYQTSTLFDRSITTNNILVPGVNFNSTAPLTSPPGVNAGAVGYQAINNFSLGRAGSQGFGGLVFAASSQNVSVLLRALQRQQRLDVLSRPQLQTLDNREARLLVGQEIPTTTGTIISQVGSTQTTTTPREVGIILVVIPQVGPDGVVVMRVNPQVSSVDQTQSIPISTDATGNVIATAPVFNVTNVETTVVAADGQTVIVGGLISRQRTQDVRKVPIVGDLPLIGHLFRTDFSQCVKRELIIVLTPRIVYCDEDVERIKAEEFQRLDWCPPDVWKVHGDVYAPAYPSVEGGDRCVDVLGQEIPANVKLPPQGRPRARAAGGPGSRACCDEEGIALPENVQVVPSDQMYQQQQPAPQAPQPTIDPTVTPMPQGTPIPNPAPTAPSPGIPAVPPPSKSGTSQIKSGTPPGNVRMAPSIQPKSAMQAQAVQQGGVNANASMPMPTGDIVSKMPRSSTQPPAGRLKVLDTRRPSAPRVENQLQQTGMAPQSQTTPR